MGLGGRGRAGGQSGPADRTIAPQHSPSPTPTLPSPLPLCPLSFLQDRFAAATEAGGPPTASLNAVAASLGAGRAGVARLFYQVCVAVTAGALRAAQRLPYGDVGLAPGPALLAGAA